MTELELRDNNLFINGRVIDFGGDEQILVRDILPIAGSEGDQYHVVMATDRLDKLAWKYYSQFVEDSSKYWWLIADANNIHNPLDLVALVGKEILIPDFIRVKLDL